MRMDSSTISPPAQRSTDKPQRNAVTIRSAADERQPRTAPRGASTLSSLTRGKKKPGMTLKELVSFTRQASMLLSSGSAVVPALHALSRQMKKPSARAVISQVAQSMEEGLSMTEALKQHPKVFNNVYCALVAAGESSATLPHMFERLANMLTAKRAMRNKLIGATIYPILLLSMCVSIMAIMLLFVMPRFAIMFENIGAELPASTMILLDVSTVLRNWWMLGVAMLLGGVGGLIYLCRSPSGRQWFTDAQTRVPLFGIVFSRLIQAQMFRLLGVLLESKVSVLESLELTSNVTRNRQFTNLFENLTEAVTSGRELSNALEHSRLIDPAICQAVRTGEESGNLDGAIKYVAAVMDEENVEIVNTATKLIEPVILVVMGVLVGGVAISLFMPLFDMTSAMN